MTAKIKLNAASGGGSVSIQAPSSSSNNRVIALPDIADGTLVTSQSTLDATKLSGNLPAINGSALTGLTAGVTEADQWRVTSDFTMNSQYAATITANWERNDTTFEKIGTGMSVDGNGHWTFPSTGKWLIRGTWIGSRSSGAQWWGIVYVYGMTDGVQSNAFELARSFVAIAANNGSQSATFECIFDVQNTSGYKLLFGYFDNAVQTTVFEGHSDRNENSFTFIKLGET